MIDPYVIVCGPAQGTKASPYRCICCRRTFADIEALAVSICWGCMSGDPKCKSCRERGVFVSDYRVGRWPDDLSQDYDPEGGLGHRLATISRTNGVMVCGERIPKAYWGDGEAVVPPCPVCWPEAGDGRPVPRRIIP